MSFSTLVKNELCRIEVNDNCCLMAELAAVIKISGTIKTAGENDVNIRIVTENAAFARHIFVLIRKLFDIYPEVIIRKSRKLKKHVSYILVITASMGAKKLLDSLDIEFSQNLSYKPQSNAAGSRRLLKKVCCRKMFLRGAFLSGGSVSDPEKTYHLELTSHNLSNASEINSLLNGFKLRGRVIRRKGSFVVYLKEGENIVDFLNIIGAHSALMELENVRILKEMRNNVNRIVNCETANLEKTINASLRQVENIKYIRDSVGFENIPGGLREIAELRLAYSDASLVELGEMLNPHLGKSGVNHRLRKLDKIAEDERRSRGEE